MNCVFCQSLECWEALYPGRKTGQKESCFLCEDCATGIPEWLVPDYLHSRLVLGNSHKMAIMFVSAQGPVLRTNTNFLSGFGANGKQFEDAQGLGDYYQGIALEAGVNPKGKVYLSGLARFPGDPEAWVSDRDEATRKAEMRGWGAEGDGVKVKPRLDYETPRVGVADEILDERVEMALADHPEPQKVNRGELRHEIYQKIKPSWAK